MGTQTYVVGSIIYFVLLFIIVSLFSIAGTFTGGNVVANTGFSSSLTAQGNETRDVNNLGFGQGNYFKDIFSFFVWNISIYNEDGVLMQYFWIFRLFFVYLPLLFLILSLYYSLPTIFGGG